VSDPSDMVQTGLAVLTGGGASGVVVRLIFGGFAKRLDAIEKTLNGLTEKVDARHEKLIVEMTQVRGIAEAAHRRLDEQGIRRRK
jgi:hypothetical protein